MSKSAHPAGKRPASGSALAIQRVGQALPEFPRRTAAEQTRWLDELIDGVNRLIEEAGRKHDAVADALFRGPFLNSVRLALDPDAPVPPGVPELLARAGKSLSLSAYEVRRYVKIGALNHHVREGAWRNLPFHLKQELVRLVDGSGDFSAFADGVAFANKANVGRDAVRAFVGSRAPAEEGERGAPRGLTPKGLVRVTARVGELDDPDARERLVERVAGMEDEAARERLIRDMDAAAKNLTKVVARLQKRIRGGE